MEKNLIQIKTKLNEKNEIKKDRKNRLKEKLANAYVRLNTFVMLMIFGMNRVYATNTSSIDGFVTFICDWLIKIGAVVMIIGGVQFAVGWKREDSDGKVNGLLTLMAGAMVAAIGKSPDIFGL